MGDLKVGRPKTATVGGLLAIVTAVFVIVVLSFGLFPEGDAALLNISEAALVYYLIMAGFVLVGGVLILCRRYRLGGIFALAFSIILLVDGGFVLIPSAVGGILALRSKEKTLGCYPMTSGLKDYCRHCGNELAPNHSGECPFCGKTGKTINVVAEDGIEIQERPSVRLKRTGFKKFMVEIIKRWRPSKSPSLSGGVEEERVIDKEKNEYHQVVRDAKTGRITHEEHEPLSKHKGKPKKPSN